MRFTWGITLLLLNNLFIQAQIFNGKIYDDFNEPLIGAVVQIENSSLYAISGLDGSFSIKLKQDGSYTASISFIGMLPIRHVFTVTSNTIHQQEFSLKPDATEFEQVTISENQNGRTIASARSTEKKADNVLNVISARAIELSTDTDVSDVAQRISGVSVEYGESSTGNTHAIIRGMSKRYNYNLVNGIKIPSPSNKTRYVPLDIFPSELLDRLEVIKNLTPQYEGDAIGGVINMALKDAPSRKTIQVNVSTGYHDFFGSRDFRTFNGSKVNNDAPHEKSITSARSSDFSTENTSIFEKQFSPDYFGSLAFGNRFINNKLGTLLAISYSNEHNGGTSTRYNPQLQIGNKIPDLSNMSEREYYSHVKRIGIHSNLDYKAGNSSYKLYGAYFNIGENQIRDNTETMATNEDLLTSDSKIFETRYRKNIQQIANLTLSGLHQLNNGLFDWKAAYSFTKKNTPDQVEFVRMQNNSLKAGYPTEIIADENRNNRTWQYNTDRDISLNLNYTLPFNIGTTGNELKTGTTIRNKYRYSYYIKYEFKVSDIEAYGHNWTPDSSTSYSTWENYSEVNFNVVDGHGDITNEFNHDFFDNYYAGYIQLKSNINKLQVLGGIRTEKFIRDYRLLAPRNQQKQSDTEEYLELLPSFHLKYRVSGSTNLRASYYKSFIRPEYFEIIPSINDFGERYVELGNPDIKPITAHNFDLRYENFFTNIDQIVIGAFYKRIFNPIEYVRRQGTEVEWANIPFNVVMPMNFGLVKNYGIEIDFTKYFRNFGIKTNYTYTNSSITHYKRFKTREVPDDITSNVTSLKINQTRPLQGQAAHIGNASLIYKNQKKGLDIQLSAVYTGKRIQNVSIDIDNDEWQTAHLKFDASIEKTIDKFTIFAKAKNLLNTPFVTVINQPINKKYSHYPNQNIDDCTVLRFDNYGRAFRIGVKYKL